MLGVGDKEMEQKQVALRLRNGENPGPIAMEDFISKVKKDVAEGI